MCTKKQPDKSLSPRQAIAPSFFEVLQQNLFSRQLKSFLFPSHRNSFDLLIQYFFTEMHGVSNGSLNIIICNSQLSTAFGFINKHIAALQSCKFHHVQSGQGGADIFLDCLNSNSKTTSVLQRTQVTKCSFDSLFIIPNEVIM